MLSDSTKTKMNAVSGHSGVMNLRKRPKEAQSSDFSTSSGAQETLTFTRLPPTKLFSKATNNFLEAPGPRHAPPPDANPIAYFNLYFTTSLLESIVRETNRYATQFLASRNVPENSRARKWKPTTVQEIRAFIAVLLEMGITKRPTIFSYWKKDSRHIPWFRAMFTRDRFQLLLKFFHLTDKNLLFKPGHPEYDPCARFEMLIKHANDVFQQYYVPNEQLYIEETMVSPQCSSSMKQYFPVKDHNKWGIKFFILCDSITKYCLNFFCYKGVQHSKDKALVKKHDLGFVVVHKLLSNHLNKGHHIFTGNFFTSLHLAKSLLKKNTFLTGTISDHRKEIPPEAKTPKAGEAKYLAHENVLMCSFKDKNSKAKPLMLISSNAGTNNVTIKKRRGDLEYEKVKPSIIHDFSKYKGNVDESDMLYVNLDEKRTLKYWKKMVCNIFGRMVLNSYILYTTNIQQTTETKMTLIQFTSRIIEDIEAEWIGPKSSESTLSPYNNKFSLEKLPGRNLRRCVICSNKSTGIKRSNLICSRCKKGLHGVCAGKHNCSFL